MNPVAAHDQHDPPAEASPLAAAHRLLESELVRVEALLQDSSWGPVPVMAQVASHLVDAGGKRLRPVLALLAARMAETPIEASLEVAAASEMIHTASLLHDDVVDETPLRRGRPAAPRVYGNATCVLVGDALMAQALCMLGELEDRRPLLSLARCVRRMAVGEIQQLAQTGRPHPRLLGYLRVVEGKTSALFAWCTTVGDLCPDPLRPTLRSFGRRLGMAFQIADDVLDYVGDPAKTGKAVGSDISEGKFTLPLHFACQEQPELLALAQRIGNSSQPDPTLLAQVVDGVRASAGLERARETARTLLRRAHRALDPCPASESRDQLHALADFVVRRTF